MPKFSDPPNTWFHHHNCHKLNLKKTKSNRDAFRAEVIKKDAQILLKKSKNSDNNDIFDQISEKLGYNSKNNENLKLVSFDSICLGFLLTIFSFCLFVTYRPWSELGKHIVTGVVFTLGILATALMCSYKHFRSCVLLVIPSITTSKGRSAMAAMALMAAINGPGHQTFVNYNSISKSLICTQQLQQKVTTETSNTMLETSYKMKYALIQTLNQTDQDFGEIRLAYDKIEENIKGVEKLYEFYNNFHLNIGDKCREHLLDFFCVIPEFVVSLIKDGVTGAAVSSLETAKRNLEVSVTFEHKTSNLIDQNGFSNATESLQNLLSDFQEITNNKELMIAKFSNISAVFFEFMIYFYWIKLYFSTSKYSKKWSSDFLYDNNEIDENIVVLDYQYFTFEHFQNTIFPISEKSIEYFQLGFAKNLTTKEKIQKKRKFFKTLIQLSMCVVILVQNRLIHWILVKIRTEIGFALQAIRYQMENANNSVKLEIKGTGLFAKSLASITNTISNLQLFEEMSVYEDINRCLPSAVKPSFDQEVLIYALVLVVFLSIVVEPWVKRLRNKVMKMVYPEIYQLRVHCLRNEIYDNQFENSEKEKEKDDRITNLKRIEELKQEVRDKRPVLAKLGFQIKYRSCSGCQAKDRFLILLYLLLLFFQILPKKKKQLT